MTRAKQKKNLKFYTAVLLILGIVLLVPAVFAQGGATDATGESCRKIESAVDFLYYLQGLMNRLRIFLGNFVGTLMTNNLVYGTTFGLDTFLWKVWQILRTIANFTIWFFFLFVLLKYLFAPNEKDANPKALIKDMVIASVLIQASWFIVLVVVDLSTILFATVGAIPSQVIGQERMVQHMLRLNINQSAINTNPDKNQLAQPPANLLSHWKRSRVTIRPAEFGKEILSTQLDPHPDDQSLSEEQLFDALLPRSNNLSGPLMYMGFSIFKTSAFVEKQDYRGINCVDTVFKQLSQLVVKSGMIFLYTIALLILAIILIGRLLYLWMFIAISPIAFLVEFFLAKYLDGAKSLSQKIFLNWSKMLKLIFQPVVFALYLSLMMLVLVMLSAVLQRPTDQHTAPTEVPFQIKQDANQSSLEVEKMLSVALKTAQFTIGDMLLAAVALALMRQLVKLAAQDSQIQTVNTITKTITDTVEQTARYMPIIPTSRGAVGFAALNPNDPDSFVQKALWKADAAIRTERTKQDERLSKLFGVTTPVFNPSEDLSLKTALRAIRNQDTFKTFQTTMKNILASKQVKRTELEGYIYDALKKAEVVSRTPHTNRLGRENTHHLDVLKDFVKQENAQKAWSTLQNKHDVYKALILAMTGYEPQNTYREGANELIGNAES